MPGRDRQVQSFGWKPERHRICMGCLKHPPCCLSGHGCCCPNLCAPAHCPFPSTPCSPGHCDRDPNIAIGDVMGELLCRRIKHKNTSRRTRLRRNALQTRVVKLLNAGNRYSSFGTSLGSCDLQGAHMERQVLPSNKTYSLPLTFAS